LIEDAAAGVVVPPENPPALADAITKLLDNPEKLRALGHNGRAFVEANLQWSRLVPEWMAQLSRVLGKEVHIIRQPQETPHVLG
jgi:glycosyltransferase involved in cell wall biosynthesis